jgi:energy-coupling factor transporter ATP-binding protein EcfA2
MACLRVQPPLTADDAYHDPNGKVGVRMKPTLIARDIHEFCDELCVRLRAGSHLILYGPRGAGKSTVLRNIGDHYEAVGTPYGLAPQTSGLADIVAALSAAYPDAGLQGLGKRAAGVRLRLVADGTPGVLLLDHATLVTTAMLGYLRRLRGGIAGALLVVDVDSPNERDRMRGWHAGALSIRMPLMSNRQLRQSLSAASKAHDLPDIEPRAARYIIRTARGRVGWVTECIRRLQMREYWCDDRLHVAVLCMDTEMAIRQSRRGPSMLRSRRSGASNTQTK